MGLTSESLALPVDDPAPLVGFRIVVDPALASKVAALGSGSSALLRLSSGDSFNVMAPTNV